MQAGLNLQQAPPIWVPFRFFLSAPLFGLLAAALMLWQGPELFASRWSASTLAATHLITLGFMTMVMAGAMMQMLPVLAGAPVPRPKLVAALVHPLLMLGTLLLAAGFLLAQPLLLQCAVVLLGTGLAVFFGSMLLTLSRVRNPTATIVAMWLASIAFGITIVLGLTLGTSHGWGTPLLSQSLRDLHPAWGLVGWTGLLVAGVAYQIVPMFQMTPNYPRWMTRGLTACAFIVLALWSLAQGATDWSWLRVASVCLLVAAYGVFAAVTLDLQRRRRRRLPDVTLEFWRVGMVALLLAALLWLSRQLPALAFAQSDVLLGVLVIGGAAVSFISGMLYKIMPFLTWFHLQALPASGMRMPNMKAILPEKAQRRQLRLHLASLGLLIAAALWPALFAYPAALSFGAAMVFLMVNLVSIVRVYRACLQRAVQPDHLSGVAEKPVRQ
ncbi:MAG: permease [Oxalobacteraceae bacterium]|nr:permease [Oxalobacteraceae bacterium]